MHVDLHVHLSVPEIIYGSSQSLLNVHVPVHVEASL
jgi:hypothetical protein